MDRSLHNMGDLICPTIDNKSNIEISYLYETPKKFLLEFS